MNESSKLTLTATVGERLKALRKAKTDLSQKEIANEIGITKQALSNYESGRNLPDHTTLIALANYYSCTTDYLYGLTEKTTQETPNYSQRESVNSLLQTMETVAEDEGDFIVSTMTDAISALAITDGNPKRREFVALVGELNGILAEYLKANTKCSKLLSQENITPEMVAKEISNFYFYDDFTDVIEDIRKTGLSAVMNFSSNAKKTLRFKKNPQKTDTHIQKQ